MIDLNWNPSTKQLRQFGLAAFVLAPLAVWIATGATRPADWTTDQQTLFATVAGAGAVIAALSLIAPALVKPIFIALSVIAFPIGLVVSECILLIIYVFVFTPVSLIFRLMKRDALDRTLNRSAKSYWQPKTQPADVTSYFRQS